MRRLLMLGTAALTSVTLAACAVPEEEPVDSAKVAQAQEKGKHRKEKSNAGVEKGLKTVCESMGGIWDENGSGNDLAERCAGLPGDESKQDAEPEQDTGPSETVGQMNARGSAESYLDSGAFSRSGLIHQLKYEGFSKADAAYAVDYLEPNWNKQAAKSAKSYLDSGSFSRSGLLHQLDYEGFTPAQAAYGVAAAGY